MKKFQINIMMAVLCFVLLISVMPINSTIADDNTNGEKLVTINNIDYVQTFNDDFEGDTLDTTKWELCPEWLRQNKCYWQDDMTSLDSNGHLVLSIDKYTGTYYKCGAVRTRNKFYQKYGYYEISCKLQNSTGFWGAFWMMPDSIDTGITGGSDGTEIDIFESAYYNSKRINHAIHYDGYGSNHKSIGTNVYANVYDGKFHTFGMDWSKDAYTFYIDGVKTYTITSSQTDISNVAEYMKITLEAGSWAGTVDETKLPDCITVDYVRAYQRNEYLDTPITTSQPTTVATTSPTVQTTTSKFILYGDVNSDSTLNSKDSLLLKKYIASWSVTIDTDAADTNADGSINGKDSLLLRQYFANWDIKLGK